jgi:hypothetical protein
MMGITSRTMVRVAIAAALAVGLAGSALADTSIWTGGTGNWDVAGNWDAGIPGDNDDVRIDNGDTGTDSVCTLNMNDWIGTLRIDAGDTLEMQSSMDLAINGDEIYNAGQLNMNAAASYTDLRIENTVTLDGGGTLSMSNNTFNRIFDGTGATPGHFINKNNAIQGSGRIGDNTLQITNRGTILANQSVDLVVDPNASGMVNKGLMQADGGTLKLNVGTYTNREGGTPGVIDAQAGSNVELAGAHIIGGRLTTSGDGIIEAVGGANTLEDLANEGSYRTNNSNNTYLIGTIDNSGDMALAGVSNFTSLWIDEQVTLTGGGTVTMTNKHLNRVLDATLGTQGHLINEDNTIQGSGQLGDNSVQITNRGTIRANQSVNLVVDPDAALVNKGLMQADGGTLRLQDAVFTNREGGTLGVIDAQAGSVVELSSAHIIGGRLTTSGDGEIKTYAGDNTLEDVANEGQYTIDSGDNTYLVGTINNSGDIGVSGFVSTTNLFVQNNVTLTGGGTVTMTNEHLNYLRDQDPTSEARLTQDAGHTIQGAGRLGDDNLNC